MENKERKASTWVSDPYVESVIERLQSLIDKEDNIRGHSNENYSITFFDLCRITNTPLSFFRHLVCIILQNFDAKINFSEPLSDMDVLKVRVVFIRNHQEYKDSGSYWGCHIQNLIKKSGDKEWSASFEHITKIMGYTHKVFPLNENHRWLIDYVMNEVGLIYQEDIDKYVFREDKPKEGIGCLSQDELDFLLTPLNN